MIRNVNIHDLAAETYLKYFILEMENMRLNPIGDYAISDMLDLYQIVRLLHELCHRSALPYVVFFFPSFLFFCESYLYISWVWYLYNANFLCHPYIVNYDLSALSKIL